MNDPLKDVRLYFMSPKGDKPIVVCNTVNGHHRAFIGETVSVRRDREVIARGVVKDVDNDVTSNIFFGPEIFILCSTAEILRLAEDTRNWTRNDHRWKDLSE